MTGGSIALRGRNLEYAVVAFGALAVLATFLPYYGASISLGGGHLSFTINAWHSYAVVGDLLLVAALAVAAIRAFSPAQLPPQMSGAGPIGGYGLAAGLAGLGTLLVIARALSTPHVDGSLAPGFSAGVQWGGYLLFLFGIVETVLAVLAVRELEHPVAPQSVVGSL